MKKTKFKSFISENSSNKKSTEKLLKQLGPLIPKIQNNLKACVETGVLLFRGSDAHVQPFGEIKNRVGRQSLTGQNVFLNFFSNFYPELPNRSNSASCSTDSNDASSFGDVSVVIPFDGARIASVLDDFNLVQVDKRKFENLDYFGRIISYTLPGILETIANGKSEHLHLISACDELVKAIRVVSDSVVNGKEEFELIDRILKAILNDKVFSDFVSAPHKFDDREFERKFARTFTNVGYTTLTITEHEAFDTLVEIRQNFNSSFIEYLSYLTSKIFEKIKSGSLKEVLDSVDNRAHEVWFEDGYVYFSRDFLFDVANTLPNSTDIETGSTNNEASYKGYDETMLQALKSFLQ